MMIQPREGLKEKLRLLRNPWFGLHCSKLIRHARGGRHPEKQEHPWIPVFTEMTHEAKRTKIENLKKNS